MRGRSDNARGTEQLNHCIESSEHWISELYLVDWTEWITGNDNREYEDGDSKTHHLDVNTGDEDADDDVADADHSYQSCTAAHSLTHID